MGSTADKLNYLLETKNAQKNYLIDKGASVDDNTPFRDYLSAFDSLSGSSGEVGKPYIDTSKITNFGYFFYKGLRRKENLDKIVTSEGTTFESMFESDSLIETLPQLDTSKGTVFDKMFNGCSKLTAIPQLDTSNGIRFTRMFYGCKALTAIPQLDTSNGFNLSYMFYGCSKLTAIPQLDTSKGTVFDNMFYDCKALTTIPQLDTSKGTTWSSVFYGCTALETVELTTAASNLLSSTFQNCTALKNITIGEGWNVNIYLHYSNELTVESLRGMIENLADLTGQTAKTFQIGATNLAKIDEEHLAMLDNKNWNYS